MRMSLDSTDSQITAWKSPRKSTAESEAPQSPLKQSEERYSLRSRAQKEQPSPGLKEHQSPGYKVRPSQF